MNARTFSPLLLCLLLCCAALVPSRMQAQTTSAGKHWYTFVVNTTGTTTTFTGSSTLTETDMATAVATGTQAISLDDLRLFGSMPNSTDPNQKWYAAPTQDRLYLVPRSVVYYFSLSGDPVGQNSSSNPVVIVK